MLNSITIVNDNLKNKVITVALPKAIFWANNQWIIILPENSMYTLEETIRFLNPIFHSHSTARFIVFSYSQYTSEIKKGNIFMCASCLTENLIYNPENLLIPTLESCKRLEILSQVTAEFQFGLGRSAAFLEGAAFHFAKQESSLSMFMLHQSSELLLRGLLISLTNQNLRSHSLNEFNSKIRKYIPKLAFMEDNGPDDKYLLEQLEYSYSSARYNIAYEIHQDRVLEVLGKIRTYTKLATQSFNDMISTFKQAYPINNSI